MSNQYYERAYEIGQQAAACGINNFDELVYSSYWKEIDRMNSTALVFLSAGMCGAEMPYMVTGWRYGHVPAIGHSYNYAADRPEQGVSLMAVDGGQTAVDLISTAFLSAGRPVVRVRGYLNTIETGSDGEPLLLDAVEIE